MIIETCLLKDSIFSKRWNPLCRHGAVNYLTPEHQPSSVMVSWVYHHLPALPMVINMKLLRSF